MDKEIIEKFLLEISTPTGLTYSGDTTICNDEIKYIMNYINDLEQKLQKQKEVIDKAIEYIKEKQKIQYKFALSHIECDDLLQILEDKEVSE